MLMMKHHQLFRMMRSPETRTAFVETFSASITKRNFSTTPSVLLPVSEKVAYGWRRPVTSITPIRSSSFGGEDPAWNNLLIGGCTNSNHRASFSSSADKKKDDDDNNNIEYTTTKSGLQYLDVLIGKGESPKNGDTVRVHYTGKLEDGTIFDSSHNRGIPLDFSVGLGQVIMGWDEGILTMKVGGKRNLIIPPELGYGYRDMGAIPPGSTLYFECELVKIVGDDEPVDEPVDVFAGFLDKIKSFFR